MRTTMNKRDQRGLSIIELMVALLLSSLLILGVTQIYLDNKRSHIFQQGQADNSDAARYSLAFLENELNKAGFRRRPDISFEEIFKADTNNGFPLRSIAAKIDNGIAIRYQAAHPEQTSCDGADIANIPDRPYVGIDAPVLIANIVFANGKLQCQGETIVEGIADYKLLYAVGERTDATRSIERYTNNPQPNEEIRGIKYDILFESPNPNASDAADNGIYQSWRKLHYNDNAAPPKKNIYQIASNTIIFRNATP